jgi:PAS domain S-box-containing protein
MGPLAPGVRWATTAGLALVLLASAAWTVRAHRRGRALLLAGIDSTLRGEAPALPRGIADLAPVGERLGQIAAERARDRGRTERAWAASREVQGHLTALLSVAREAVLWADERGHIVRTSWEAERLFGVSGAQAMDLPLCDLVREGLREEFRAAFFECLSSGKPVRWPGGEGQSGRHRDGTALALEWSLTCGRTGGERFVTVVARPWDTAAAGELSHVFASALDLLCVLRLDGRIARVNPMWEATLGFRAPELVGRHWLDLVALEDRERSAAWFDLVCPADRAATLLDDGGEAGATLLTNRCQHRDGSYRWLLWKGVLDFERSLFHAAARDVTEIKDAEAEIRRLNAELAARVQELQEANRDLEAFSASASHDLRAPLRHVGEYIRLARRDAEGKLGERAERHLATAAEAAHRAASLVDGLLAFSRAGRAEMRWAPVDLDALVAEVVAEVQRDARGRDVRFAVEALPTVRGDATLLRAVFVNLLGNALKFTRLCEHAEIEVRAEPGEGKRWTFSVRDNGVGFDPGLSERLFESFQRLHREDEFEGAGLGLATVRRIVERHGGRIWGEGRPGEGATFRFTLEVEATDG